MRSPNCRHTWEYNLGFHVSESCVLEHLDVSLGCSKMDVGLGQPFPWVVLHLANEPGIAAHPDSHPEVTKPSMHAIHLCWIHNNQFPTRFQNAHDFSKPSALIVPITERE